MLGNYSGELATTSSYSVLPVPIANIAAVRVVALATLHVRAVLESGAVDCWGRLDSGNALTPQPVPHLAGATFLVASDSAYSYYCAIATGGKVYCWGSLDNATGDYIAVTPVAVANVSGATQISARPGEACALLAPGTVKCWEIGKGSDVNVTHSTKVFTVAGVSGATGLASGIGGFCATLGDGRLKCWGDKEPAIVPGVDGVSAVAFTTDPSGLAFSTCAVVTDGKVKCWGDNTHGQLGSGTTEPSAHPVDVTNLSGVTFLAGDLDYYCAIVSSGVVKCWGSNDYASLGDGAWEDSSVPVAVLTAG